MPAPRLWGVECVRRLGETAPSGGRQYKASYSASSDTLNVSWSAVSNAGRYKVNLLEADDTLSSSHKTSTNSKEVPAAGLLDGRTYLIQIQALATKSHAASAIKSKTILFSTRVSTPEYFGPITTSNSSGRNGTVFLPQDYRLKRVRAMLLFHGSSIDGRTMANVFKSSARSKGFVILAPDSTDERGWEISDRPNNPSADQIHVENCLAELTRLPHLLGEQLHRRRPLGRRRDVRRIRLQRSSIRRNGDAARSLSARSSDRI